MRAIADAESRHFWGQPWRRVVQTVGSRGMQPGSPRAATSRRQPEWTLVAGVLQHVEHGLDHGASRHTKCRRPDFASVYDCPTTVGWKA